MLEQMQIVVSFRASTRSSLSAVRVFLKILLDKLEHSNIMEENREFSGEVANGSLLFLAGFEKVFEWNFLKKNHLLSENLLLF